MAGHTPGPWETGEASWNEDGEVRYTIHGVREAKSADARLINAAPDLLEALQAIADESIFNKMRFEDEDDTDYFLRCFRAVKEHARAAIAKATGEA